MTGLTLRRATVQDALVFYDLRLDRETRRFLPDITSAMTWQDHLDWYLPRVAAASWWVAECRRQRTYVQPDGRGLETVSVPVGALRLDAGEADGDPWVSIIVAPQARGQGYGLAMLEMAQTADAEYRCGELAHPVTGTSWAYRPLRAIIHHLNTPSLRVFQRAGFVNVTPEGMGTMWRTYRKPA